MRRTFEARPLGPPNDLRRILTEPLSDRTDGRQTRPAGLLGLAAGLGLIALLLALPVRAAVFWLDDRVTYAEATDEQRQFLLDATGAIECMDGTVGTGFMVDISEYVEGTPRLGIIATAMAIIRLVAFM